MKIVYSSDLHGIKDLYLMLFDVARQVDSDAVILGGDMLPLHGPFQYSILEQEEFITTFLEPVVREFRVDCPMAHVYAMLGNDDWQASSGRLLELAQKGDVRQLHAEKHPLGSDYEIIGYAHVPPTPFSIKDAERRDLKGDAPGRQRCTACRSIGKKIVAVDPVLHFSSLKSMEEELAELPVPRSFDKAVYVMHSPPFGTNLDRLSDGRMIGSRAIRGFIEMYQPYVTLHGHIHESSEVSGDYLDRVGKTICINPGQSNEELYAVLFELEDVVDTIEHTVFGKQEGKGIG